PVAGLVYAVDSPGQAVFYPMAAFSPEWVALRWALERGLTVRFADLPMAHVLALREREQADEATVPQESEVDTDPIAVLARAAGYTDPERWWEDAIEHRIDSLTARFAQITDAMGEVRSAYPELHDEENARREAFMRKVIREVMASHGTVAVVC